MLLEFDWLMGLPESVAAIYIPTIASIIVFVLGYLINLLIDLIKRHFRRKRLRRALKVWIDIISIPLQKDINSLKKLAIDIEQNVSIQQPAFEWFSIMGDKLENAITEDAMISIRRTYWSKQKNIKNQQMIYNLVSQAHFLKEKEKEIIDTYHKYESRATEMIDKWNKLYIEIGNLNNHILTRVLKPGEEAHTKLQQIVNLHNASTIKQPNNFEVSYTTLIPAMDITLFKTHQDFQPINELLPQASLIYTQWNSDRQNYPLIFNSLANSIEYSLNKLKDVQSNL